MNKYSLNPAVFGTHKLVAEEIMPGKIVLDVGCSQGYLKRLVGSGTFWGIDHNTRDLELAKKTGYQHTFKMDLNYYRTFKSKQKFDYVVMADILEHLNSPNHVLNYFVRSYLKTDGRLIVSLPNVAHISIRLGLLFGIFDYTESGILDRTHLHLFTLKNARELLKNCGLKIIKEKFSSNHFGRFIKKFPFLATLLGYNLIFLCQRKS